MGPLRVKKNYKIAKPRRLSFTLGEDSYQEHTYQYYLNLNLNKGILIFIVGINIH